MYKMSYLLSGVFLLHETIKIDGYTKQRQKSILFHQAQQEHQLLFNEIIYTLLKQVYY